MDFENWKQELGVQLAGVFGMPEIEGHAYVQKCGEDCWRDGFEDGLSPRDQAIEEALAAAEGTGG